jgi:SAM-dependent methyltransferase
VNAESSVDSNLASSGRDTGPPRGVHLVGSVPLSSAEEVFRTVAAALGDRLRRVPDGETGPRSDWIVWQYPVLSSRPQFEIAPPDLDHYRPLPRLKLREGEDGADLRFGSLGYAEAARSSYSLFARLKRDRAIPRGCRFQVCLPTPLAPISAFVAPSDQAVVERPYEERMLLEVEEILDAIPSDQLAVQWDTNFEFGMLEGVFPVWFSDVKGGILERLLRISRQIPPQVELGFHLCYGDTRQRHYKEPEDAGRLVAIANALAAGLDRPLNWIHMPVPQSRNDRAYFAPLRELRLRPETEFYLGLVHDSDGAEGSERRISRAREVVQGFGVASECGWGRRAPATVPRLLDIHAAVSQPVAQTQDAQSPIFEWPAGFPRIPDDQWVQQPVDSFGLQYDTVDNHGWYRNLDPTVEQLVAYLRDGQILMDYSGGTGILLNRLRLRIFDRQIGMMIVDSSPKFLRVALEHFRDDPRVSLRLIRWLKEERRLQYVDEVVEPAVLERGLDMIVSTNAIHLYGDLADTLRSWARVLKPGGLVFVNSGNVRNPQARPNEWILDETVYVIHEVATGIVRTDPRYADYRSALDDEDRMASHLAVRDRVFLPPRPLRFYLEELQRAGLAVEEVTDTTIDANVDEWFEFLKAYHEPLLGWVGGSERIDGSPATEAAVEDRLALIRHSMELLFGGRQQFRCCWTYLRCRRE